MVAPGDLENRFVHHPPANEQQVKTYGTVRGAGYSFAKIVYEMCPDSDEREIAIRAIESAVMWANAAIARRS